MSLVLNQVFLWLSTWPAIKDDNFISLFCTRHSSLRYEVCGHSVKQCVVLHCEENSANPTPSTGEINLYVVVLQGRWIERDHCMIDNHRGIVTLRPVHGAHCTVNGCEVTGSCRLSQGKACFFYECCIIIILPPEFRDTDLWNSCPSKKYICQSPTAA